MHICFLFFYYECQMAGLKKCRVYIFIILVWIVKMQHIAICYEYHILLCVFYNIMCIAILTDDTTRTTRPLKQ
jgi:hypothetical protein